jgi:hypothetical protein
LGQKDVGYEDVHANDVVKFDIREACLHALAERVAAAAGGAIAARSCERGGRFGSEECGS